eukprot:1319506-Pyramimonas_sp.AAC.1
MCKVNDRAMVDLTGYDANGCKVNTATSAALRQQGATWADHVLEAPLSWLLSATYILVTVVSGYPVVYGSLKLAGI